MGGDQLVCTTTVTSGVTTLERSIANAYNPFRYRGYFYDVESGYYYLQSRYYNPTWGRFLNADGVAYLGVGDNLLGYNLYAYCGNNPVNLIDPTGNVAIVDDILIWTIVALFVIIAIPKVIKTVEMVVEGVAEAAVEISYSIDEARARAAEKEETEDSKSEAIYYGVDVVGGTWNEKTGPMTFEEALIWTETIANSNVYTKRNGWGVYTFRQEDAYEFATALGEVDKSETHPGCYPHYHMKGHKFRQYDHFHVWYGTITP